MKNLLRVPFRGGLHKSSGPMAGGPLSGQAGKWKRDNAYPRSEAKPAPCGCQRPRSPRAGTEPPPGGALPAPQPGVKKRAGPAEVRPS